MMEFRNSARGHLIALEIKVAIGYYLEGIMKDTNMKQKAYRTLASSEMHFEEGMRTTSKVHALRAIPYFRTEVQLRLNWCLARLTREENDSEERKRSKEEKVLLMMALSDLMIKEEAAMACAKRRDALCFIRFVLEQMSTPAMNTCAKIIQEGCEPKRTLLLEALVDVHQSKLLRVNMKEPEDLEPLSKNDEIRRFSNKELRLSKESIESL